MDLSELGQGKDDDNPRFRSSPPRCSNKPKATPSGEDLKTIIKSESGGVVRATRKEMTATSSTCARPSPHPIPSLPRFQRQRPSLYPLTRAPPRPRLSFLALSRKEPGALPVEVGSSTSSSVIDFLTLCHSLKTTKRKGWLNHGIKGAESIADHMYRMSLMALIAGDVPGLNRERCIKIAIVHDIAEAIVGDITPSDGVPKAEKSRREREALDHMCEVLGGGMRAEEIKELWSEYENNSSLEANLVKDFDKVEMILQALEYEMEHGKVLDEFFLSTAGKFQTDIGKSWAAEILSRRNSRLADGLN